MGNYIVAQTTETSEDGMVQTPGNINGGFFDYKDQKGFDIPHIVISVDNIEESMKDVEEAGGKIIGGASGSGKIDDIPGIGRYIAFEDSEGNHVGILQPTS